MDTVNAILTRLESLRDPASVTGKAHYGINPQTEVYGIKVTVLRDIAREIKAVVPAKNRHALALDLWATKVHEARHLATMLDEYKQVTRDQMEAWATEFDAWDIVDAACMNLFWRVPGAWDVALDWSKHEPEFIKRAGFALMATAGHKGKDVPPERYDQFFAAIQRGATDERNYVKKAVSWALRQIGKRDADLNARAIATAETIAQIDDKTPQWVARDALKELTSDKVQAKLKG